MTPVYFPSTWIPEKVRNALFACFKQVTLLQPSQLLAPEPLRSLEKKGRLRICLPDEIAGAESGDELPDLLNAYREWGNLHRGEDRAFHKFAGLLTPAPDDTSIARIRSEIRNATNNDAIGRNSDDDVGEDPLRTARLFLAIAQDFERQDESLSRDFDAIGNMERNLLKELTPDEPSSMLYSPNRVSPSGTGPVHSMSAHQLAAWRLLYAHCLECGHLTPQEPASLYISNDQEAIRLVLDCGETPEAVCRINGIPAMTEENPFVLSPLHQQLSETLRSAAHGHPLFSDRIFSFSDQEPGDCESFSAVFYRIKGNPLADARSKPENRPDPSAPYSEESERFFTLVGHFEKR
jgi:hypothetical protein